MKTKDFKSTDQQLKEASVKTIHDCIVTERADNWDKFSNQSNWADVALMILMTVSECGSGFKKDIATKAIESVNISEKQAWCVAYEFVNVR